MKVIKIVSVIIALVLMGTACASPPTTEMNNAIAAVTRAENDPDAVFYAGNTLIRARDALNRMQAEADAKRYDAARSYAAEAIAAADTAIADGRAGTIRARDEATALVQGLPAAIAETDQNIRAARGAGLDLNFPALNHDLENVRQDTSQAESFLSANMFQDALDMGRTAQSGLTDINLRLSAAALAVSRDK